MSDDQSPTSVEFDDVRVDSTALAAQHSDLMANRSFFSRLSSPLRWVRAVVTVVGAAAVAWATQRAGVGLSGALCVFIGCLPFLWGAGWLASMVVMGRVVGTRVKRELEARGGFAGLVANVPKVSVRVRLVVTEAGLEVTEGAAPARLAAWSSVTIDRLADAAWVNVMPGDGAALRLTVPGAAFASADAFDDFCLQVQRHIWRAGRLSPTSFRE